MSQSNFSGGFLLGAIVGGVVGGVLGAVLTAKVSQESEDRPESLTEVSPRPRTAQPASLKSPSGMEIESARRSLEDKIAQLNEAIDDVRQQLGSSHQNGLEDKTASIPESGT